MDKQPATYTLASDRNGTIYIGVTSDLIGRVWQHREHVVDGFTSKYSVNWYEMHGTMEEAITREKRKEMEQGLEDSVDRGAQSVLE